VQKWVTGATLPIGTATRKHPCGSTTSCIWAVSVRLLSKVQAYAGQRDIKTTQRYVHHQIKADDAALGGAYLDRVLPSARWRIARRLGPAYRGGNEEEHMTDRIDVARELYEAVAAGDREAIAGRLAADVRWQGRERGRRGHRRRSR
jgi:hypothetical protein